MINFQRVNREAGEGKKIDFCKAKIGKPVRYVFVRNQGLQKLEFYFIYLFIFSNKEYSIN